MAKRITEGEIWVFPFSKWVIDVFTGKGFENHSRFHIFKGHLKLVAGEPVTDAEYKQLQKLVAQ